MIANEDGIIYLPEIKYRRILNKAFGPGGWGLAPRSETLVTPKSVSREYALVCHGRLVSVARGEQDYFDAGGVATATEGCKSNALMRCCKDLGIASELWYHESIAWLMLGTQGLFASLRESIVWRPLPNMWLRRRYGSFGDGRMMYLNIHTRKRKGLLVRIIYSPL